MYQILINKVEDDKDVQTLATIPCSADFAAEILAQALKLNQPTRTLEPLVDDRAEVREVKKIKKTGYKSLEKKANKEDVTPPRKSPGSSRRN